jgi:predicted TIM-barrel fold metal-dependent hydrolase
MAIPSIIDADSHVTEARDTWTARMSSAKWGDLVPQVRMDDETGKEAWFVGPNRMGLVGWSGWQAVDPETGGRRTIDRNNPVTYQEELHPSCYDARERLNVMDEMGVHAAALYPNINMIHTDIHSAVSDPKFKHETIAAYNDWLVEWCSVDPQRLLALALVPHFDVHLAAEEVYRAKSLGHKGLVMSGIPQLHGEPYLADRYWDPLWAAAEEVELPISFHLGSGPNANADLAERIALEGSEAYAAHAVVDMLLGNAMSCADLLMSGILPRFPHLQFISAEGGIGWVNFVLETLDQRFHKFNIRAKRPEFEEPPSFYFRRQVHVTYWYEKMTDFHLERIGADRILFETDYPHLQSLEREDIEAAVAHGLGEVSQETQDRVLWRNAAELYGLEVPVGAQRT